MVVLPGQIRLSKVGGGGKRMGKESNKVKIIQIPLRLINRDPKQRTGAWLTWKFSTDFRGMFLGLGLICSFFTHSLWHNQTRVTLVNTLGSASIKLLSIDPIS